jgi:YbbR domain-containing protein
VADERAEAVIGGPISWVVTNWRLKLLSLVLAIGLLGGVAFSENPPVFGSVPVKVNYNLPQPTDLVIVNPTTSLDVPVAGFRSDVQRYQQTTAGVTVDLSHAHPGRNQTYQARPRTDIQGLTFRQSAIPLTLDIEPLVTRQLDIEVRTPNKAAGIAVVPDRTYATCGNANDHCQVSVTGPASVLATLEAYVAYDVQITTASSGSSPNQPIKFEQNGRPADIGKSVQTVPQIQWTPEVVTVQVTTQGGSQTKSVPVSVRVQGSQPCGYQITGVDVTPSQVTINGPADAVGKITSVNLDPIPLTGLTIGQRFVRNVVAGTGVSADPQTVVVNVSGYQAFNCAAPSPAAGVLPAPLPTPTPTPTPTRTPSPSVSP